MSDLPLFFGCGSKLRLGIVAEALLEQSQHLSRALAGGGDDEEVSEPRFIAPVRLGELGQDLGAGSPRAGLLLLGPTPSLLADPRVRLERFQPVLRRQT